MKFTTHFISICVVFFVLSANVSIAHPGNTASDGCHYCRTNCESWGYDYGTRHCHGGGTSTYSPPPEPQTWDLDGTVYYSEYDYNIAVDAKEKAQKQREDVSRVFANVMERSPKEEELDQWIWYSTENDELLNALKETDEYAQLQKEKDEEKKKNKKIEEKKSAKKDSTPEIDAPKKESKEEPIVVPEKGETVTKPQGENSSANEKSSPAPWSVIRFLFFDGPIIVGLFFVVRWFWKKRK